MSRIRSATGIIGGTFDEISQLLYHGKIRQVFAEADGWLKESATNAAGEKGRGDPAIRAPGDRVVLRGRDVRGSALCPRNRDPRRPRSPGHRGFYLALDGPDGAGKTTQAVAIADWLRSEGIDVVSCREPGGTPLGDQLRSIVMDRSAISISMRAELLIYMASRAQLVDEVIRPALTIGRVVLFGPLIAGKSCLPGVRGGIGAG